MSWSTTAAFRRVSAMSDARNLSHDSSKPQRFSIVWDEGMGYRVSVPCLLVPGQRLEVIEAAPIEAELAACKSQLAQYREGWLSRGRSLNKVYDAIASLLVDVSTGDPVKDLEAIGAELARLRSFVEWVAAHKLVRGIYADDEHPYDEWITPEGDEADLDEIHSRACEAAR